MIYRLLSDFFFGKRCRLFFILPTLLISFVCGSFTAEAQWKADFSADITDACHPFTVHFTDKSSGAPTNWKWDFGDNEGFSYEQNPAKSFDKPGKYTITLTIGNSITGKKDTIVRESYIEVYETPKALFSATPLSGCSPLDVHFTDHSVAGSGTINSWFWDFGDGITGVGSSPDHIYHNFGTPGASLIVTDDNGCTGSSTEPTTINVAKGLDAHFTADRLVSCSSTMTVNFHAGATSNQEVTYKWDFGDQQFGTGSSPSNFYSKPGDYTVRLIATVPNGCPDTVIQKDFIHVASFHPDFNVPNGCVGVPLTFENTSSPSPNLSVWDFSDGTTGGTVNAVHRFDKSGPYDIRLVNYYDGCTDTVIHHFKTIPPPVARFSLSTKADCGQPTKVTFKNTSSEDAASFAWDFGDGYTSTEKEPHHDYTKSGNFVIALLAKNDAGCSSAAARPESIEVLDPVIDFYASQASGCTPLTVNFQSQVSNAGAGAKYFWDFGDKQTAIQASPTHIFAKAGRYTVKLKVATGSGCSDSLVRVSYIQVSNPPTLKFAVSSKVVCRNTPVEFTNNSDAPDASWAWYFPDDGYGHEDGPNPQHQFSNLGKQDVVLTANNNGCIVKLTKKGLITVEPPMASFGVSQSCSDPYTVAFTDKSIEATGWKWDFGDGKTSDAQNPPPHKYAAMGSYRVNLETKNGECTSDTSINVNVIDLHPVLKVSTLEVCHGTTLVYSLEDSNNAKWIHSYTWVTGTGEVFTTRVPNFSFSYSKSGIYNAQLVTTDINGCMETSAVVPITVTGPVAGFQLSSPNSCKGKNVTFKDHSAVAGSSVMKWDWDFGDGTTQTLSDGSVTHTYEEDGQYSVRLKVTDGNGCADETAQAGAVSVFSAKADFSTVDNPTCPGSPVRWANTSLGNQLTYQWSFGDNTGSSQAIPVKMYPKEGTYSVSLKVKSNIGCMDSMSREDYIKVVEPRAKWEYSDNHVTCPPFIISVVNKSENYSRILWDFGDGSTSYNTRDVTHVYTMGGSYRLRMLAYGYGDGCIDSVVKMVEVNGPSGSSTVTDSIGCSPHTVGFSAVSMNAASYQWDFGDGNVSDPSAKGKITHTYEHGGIYQPKLILADSRGCQVSLSTDRRTKIDETQIAPSVTLPDICDSSLLRFQVSGSIFTRDSLYLPASYEWDFGDPGSVDNQSNGVDPEHHFAVPHGYTAHIELKTVYGCDVRKSVPVRIPRPFVMQVTASHDTIICKGSAATLHASGAYRYVWTPAIGLDSVNSDSPIATPAVTTTYRVIGYARGNCQIDTAYTTVAVRNPPDAVISTIDTLICPGAPITWVNESVGNQLSYQWDFGDGTSSTKEMPAKDYIQEGIYTVSLKVKSKIGCWDSVTKENYIRVGEPHAHWNYADSNASCVPLVISIKNLSSNYRKILWDFGDGTTSKDTDRIRHAYGIPGTYHLRMLVYGFSRDCMDSIVKTVVVKGPYGHPKVIDSIGCSPFAVQFSAVATNTVSYRWDFGDGTASTTSASDKMTHTYQHGGIFQPSLQLTDQRGCQIVIPATRRIKVDEIHIGPSVTFPDVCDSSIRKFEVGGTIFTKDSLNMPVSYQWNFGDPASVDNTSTSGDPQHNYDAAGKYSAKVTLGTAYGCEVDEPVNVLIPQPYVIKIAASADTLVCKGSPVSLHVTGGARYVWTPPAGLSSVGSDAPIAIPDITTTYQVIGYSVADCQSDTAHVEIVVKNQPQITLTHDTTIGTGSTFMLPVTYTPDAVTWNWEPPLYLDCGHCAVPVSTPHSPIAYRVVTANQWGCSDTASVNVHLICKEGKVFIPNTFTPNGDGMNDIFYPRGQGVSKVLRFQIYDRWGQLIYDRSYFPLNDISAGWNGTFKGRKLAPGVFIYQTLMRCESGSIFKLNGSITLLR